MTWMHEPAWLISLVDQRLALIEHAFRNTPLVEQPTVIMSPLKEPESPSPSKTELEYWERSCDNCGKYSKPHEDFFTGTIIRSLRSGVQVTLSFGVCKQCHSTFKE